ncbi:two-component regulator propeller domain-containing protein [Carboxylicivirga sp. M1479]|uniref:ligand-binding sensor domain-containing protein n=1 Tax=Carboxylicivirga sp. M1479 TaxID=2594476 RepID=UPI00117763B2|nr:two-component regulator propeller domain-containing protein [Carboxylicivirga sp. M1479]TRX70423.1 hypothetical protein FNN09_11925 [Carboxylicivirga sp. M1479]
MISSKVYCLLIVLLYFYAPTSSAQDFQVNYLSVEDGLSQNEVTSIVQDSYGFMWFGTRGGLNRYDGYSFKHYKPSIMDSGSISNPSIEALLLNKEQDILIGLKSGGPAKYDYSAGVFEVQELAKRYGLNRVVSFCEDEEDNTWIGSWSNGVLCLNKDTAIHYKGLDQVRSIQQTEDGTVWFATSAGLKYKKKTDKIIQTFIGTSITSLVADKVNKCLWLLGWNQDLMKIDYHTMSSKHYPNNKAVDYKNFTLYNDTQGILWVGTWGNGLFQFNKETEEFKKVNIYPFNSQSASVDFDIIRDVFEDKVGDIWLGTQAGIVRISRKNNFKYINGFDQHGLNRVHVSAIYIDNNGRKWVGTSGNGLFYSDDGIIYNRVSINRSNVISKRDDLSVKAYVFINVILEE